MFLILLLIPPQPDAVNQYCNRKAGRAHEHHVCQTSRRATYRGKNIPRRRARRR